MNTSYQRLREVKNLITAKNKKSATIRFIYRNIFLKLPVKQNLVYFESFGGKSYSDSPKYIYEHLINHEDGYKYVCNFNNDEQIPGNATIVKKNRIKYYYNLSD